MRKVLMLLMIAAITFSSFFGIVNAGVDNNSGGNKPPGGGSGSGPGVGDSCPGYNLCVWWGQGHTIAYRLSFVYVSPKGDYKPMTVTRTSKDGTVTKNVYPTMDIYVDSAFPKQMDYITSTLGSKAQYLNNNGPARTFDLIKIDKKNQTNYIEGINYLTFDDPKLEYFKEYYRKFYGSINMEDCNTNKYSYCYGAGLMELFVGSEKKDEWNQLLQTAKIMGIVSEGATLGTLKNIARDSSGNVLKLLVEPIVDVRFSPNSGGCVGANCSTNAVLTLTELITALQANNGSNGWKRVGWYQNNGQYKTNVKVQTTVEKRYSCYIPTWFYLDHPDEELRIAQYKNIGITSYLMNKGINPCVTKSNIGGALNTYNSSISSLMSQYCKDGNCYYNYGNSYYRTGSSAVILSPDFIYRNMGVAILDLSDIFVASCPPVYRTISLSNPFPGHDGTNTRIIGDNWYSTDGSVIKKFITNNRGTTTDNVYNLEPMYKIVLTPTLIQNIRNYNKTKTNYSYDELIKCDTDGKNCQSNFVRSNYRSSFSGCKINGTC